MTKLGWTLGRVAQGRMERRVVFAALCALLVALTFMAVSAPRASALCPVNDPTCGGGGGGTTTGTGYLRVDKVAVNGGPVQNGAVADASGTNLISCAEGCSSQTASATYTCVDSDCSYGSVTLWASSSNGWLFDHWSGCASTSGAGGASCTTSLDGTTGSPRVVQAYYRDNLPPSVDFSSSAPAANSTLQGKPSFNANATDNSGVASVTWTVGTPSRATVASATATSPPYGFSWDTTSVLNGTYNVFVYATDIYNNRSASTYRTYTVANPLPTINITSAPGAYLNQTSFAFAFNAAGSSAVSSTCALDGGASHTCGGTDTVSGLSQGAHTWAITATDHGGNASSASRSFIVDTIGPTVSITGGPSEGGEVHTSDLTFTYTASDANGVTGVQCSLDGVVDSCGNGEDDLHNVAAGSHTWTVQATDAAGNVTTVTRHFERTDSSTSGGGTTGGDSSGGSTTGGGTSGAGTTGGGTPGTQPSTPRCVVPNLRGKTLAQARKLLANAHCLLGKVSRQKAKARSRGRVIGERLTPGKRVAAGTKVAVTIGR